jgi:hypothetical protein
LGNRTVAHADEFVVAVRQLTIGRPVSIEAVRERHHVAVIVVANADDR